MNFNNLHQIKICIVLFSILLIIGIFLTIFFPKLTVEKIKARHLWPKIIAITITGIGTYLLFIS